MLLYQRAVNSFKNRSGVLTPETISKGKWHITERGLTRSMESCVAYMVMKPLEGGYVTSLELDAQEWKSTSFKKLRKEFEVEVLMKGEWLDPSPIMEQIQERIELDARLTAAINEEGSVKAPHPIYNDAQYVTSIGFIHQTGGGRLTLCTEAEHEEWIRHYESAWSATEAFQAWQDEVRDTERRRIMG